MHLAIFENNYVVALWREQSLDACRPCCTLKLNWTSKTLQLIAGLENKVETYMYMYRFCTVLEIATLATIASSVPVAAVVSAGFHGRVWNTKCIHSGIPNLIWILKKQPYVPTHLPTSARSGFSATGRACHKAQKYYVYVFIYIYINIQMNIYIYICIYIYIHI